MTADRDRLASIDFIKFRFKRHYEKCDLQLPERFGRREFGFLHFGRDSMQRHMGFRTRAEIKDFLTGNPPMHAYHSAAYYEMPDAPTMDEKHWLGADLIFDLDADHLKNAKDMKYEDMLAAVKVEFEKLLYDYVMDDLGFSREHMTVVFSGARGYHLHIRDPRVLQLQSHERREIVDYITGPGIDDIEEFVFESIPYDRKEYKDRNKHVRLNIKYVRRMPRESDEGWSRKMRKGMENLLKELEGMGKEKGVKFLSTFKGVGDLTAEGIWEDLYGGVVKGASRMLSEDTLEIFSKDKHRDSFIKVVIEAEKVKLEGETDEPVTSDIKRLIRLPSSLHGKTGLMAKAVELDELADFNPLEDAISPHFGAEKTGINVVKPANIELGGEKFNLDKGISKIPEYAAVFLVCRGMAVPPKEVQAREE